MKLLFSHPHLGAFFIAVFLADILTPVARHIAWITGIIDQPSPRKIHKQPTALLGGLGVFLAYLIAVVSTLEFSRELLVVLVATSLIFFLGLVDDVAHLPAMVKLLGLFFISLGLYHFGIFIEFLPKGLNLLVTLLWFAYASSCLNAMDNMDGLCAGTAAICSFFFYLISYETGQPFMGYIAIALCGACIGFLRYNLVTSKIFLGDGGAFFLGFTLAVISVMGNWGTHAQVWKAMAVPLCILFVPLYDLFITTLLRFRAGVVKNLRQAIACSAKDHLSHRILLLFGGSPLRSVLILYVLTALWGLTGMLVRISSPLLAFSQIGLMFSLTLGLTLKIKDAPVSYE